MVEVMGRKYRVEYERDADGVWVAVIDRAQGASCVAQGRSFREARRRIRSALGVYLDDPKAAAAAELVDDVKLPAGVKLALAKAIESRETSQRMLDVSARQVLTAAEKLTSAGVSRRDAADLLGVSHQRIQQLAAPPRRAAASARAR